LAGAFRSLLDLTSRGGNGDIREALSIIISAGLVWAYHAYILQRDAELAEEQPGQTWVRQLYFYLVAAVGLAAFLIGLSGNLSVLIRYLSGALFSIPEEAAWFVAVLIAGLPVWVLPWRRSQIVATAPGPAGDEESHSIIRKIYLYFFLFVATMTVLSGGVYIVYRLIGLALGERTTGNLVADMGQAIAFSLIAVGVWLYHGSILRADSRRADQARSDRLTSLRVAIVDIGDGSFGHTLSDELRSALPGLVVQPLGLAPEASAALTPDGNPPDLPAVLGDTDVIVGPWAMAVPGTAEGAVDAQIARAVATSPARKLLIPEQMGGWNWIGVAPLARKDIVQQTVRAVKQIAAGEEVSPVRALSTGAIVAIVIGVLVLLIGFVLPLAFFFAGELLY
jgi:hypothetical protein